MENSKIKKDLLPDDSELRVQLKKRAKIMNYLGWTIFVLAVIFLIIYWNSFDFLYTLLLFIILIMGQILRFYSKFLIKRSESEFSAYSPKLLKKYKNKQENIVKEYFQLNPDIASKVLQMDKLAKNGKFKDAINISNNLLKQSHPKPIIIFLKNKKDQYRARS